MPQNTIHLVGFGSQGAAWAECLRTSGWNVEIYLASKSRSFQKAIEKGFQPRLLSELPQELQKYDFVSNTPHWIAMLCPDSAISGIYGDFLASCPQAIRLILAHGFAVYSGELKFQNPQHQAALLAPKAIGPKLLEYFKLAFPQPHSLVAAVSAPPGEEHILKEIARGLGFNQLVPATFYQETIGDLISEQGLLCGGVFNLIDWTMEAMFQAGVPKELIREECLTELELVIGLIRSRGISGTFQSISQAAQAGTIAMRQRMIESGFKSNFDSQMVSLENQEFVQYFNSQNWRKSAQELREKLAQWERKLDDHLSQKEGP